MDWTLHSPFFIGQLVALGIGVGFLTGLFGVGGGFIATPIMISMLGVDPTVAVGSSLGFTLGASSFGLRKHWRSGNLASRTALLVGGGSTVGMVFGYFLHNAAAQMYGEQFDRAISIAFVALLGVVAALLMATANRVARRYSPLANLRLPPYIHIRKVGMPISIIGLIGVGIPAGMLGGLFGVGGGIVLIPILTLVVGLTPHVAVGTSLGAVLISSIVGCALYAFGSRSVDLAIIAALVAGSWLGTKLGVWTCNRLHAKHLQRLFALVVATAAIFLLIQLLFFSR